ncbi:MAG TPA: cell wall hydrolase [Allosphingosinicella sp.]|nr:cell wall hydrolase [Allosphingosinicella sp.]
MNRIVRAAGFAAAAVALFAGATYSDPAGAVEIAAVAVAPPGAAASTMSDPDLFAKMWASVTSLVTPKTEAAPTVGPAPVARLADLVLAYAATQTTDREQECLANAVYFEARSEPIEGQLAVAEVVMNRAASGRYPSDLCAVITQKAQFSFIRRGQFPRADRDSEAWKKAVAIARIARQKLAGSLPADVLWYHATYVSPSWGKRLTRQTQIGLHIFYS